MGHGFKDAVQHVAQVAARGTHPARGTDLLVVEHRPDRGAGAVGLPGRIQKAQQRRGGTFQIVNARGHEKFTVGADLGRGLAGDELQIAVQNVGGLHTEGLGDEVGQGAAARGAPQRLHIDLRVEGVALVDVPLKVDGQRRDDEQVAVKVHKVALDAVLGLDEGAPADGQRAVQPGGHDHPAVALDAQAAAAVVFNGVGLDFPRRGVAVAGHDAPAADGVLRHAPRHNGRAVAGRVVALARLKVPVVGLLQPGEAGCAQPAFGGGSGVERGDGLLQKLY